MVPMGPCMARTFPQAPGLGSSLCLSSTVSVGWGMEQGMRFSYHYSQSTGIGLDVQPSTAAATAVATAKTAESLPEPSKGCWTPAGSTAALGDTSCPQLHQSLSAAQAVPMRPHCHPRLAGRAPVPTSVKGRALGTLWLPSLYGPFTARVRLDDPSGSLPTQMIL